jgi:hypothetical protein
MSNLPAPAAPDPLPWERQPGEPPRAYAYFADYRNDGPLRSIAKTARNRRRSVSTLNEMSQRHRWVERAEAYDEYLDRLRRDAAETEIQRAERQERAAARQLQAIATTRIFGRDSGVREDGSIVEAVDPIDPRTLDALDAVRILSEATRLRRVVDGQPTDILKASNAITAADLVRVVEGIYEIASRFIDDDRLPRFASEIQGFIDTGRLPWQDR